MTVSFQIQKKPNHLLTGSERLDIVRICNSAFATERYHELFTFLQPDALHLLGYWNENLVAHAVVTTRWLQLENSTLLRTAYVDAVAVLPTVQSRGFGSTLLRELAASITGYDIACLETDRVSFYARLGWQEWRGALAGRGSDGLIPTPDQHGVMILRLPRTPELDLHSLLTVEDQHVRIW